MSVLAFHKVDDAFEFGVTRCTPRRFKQHLNLIEELNLMPCSLGEYLNSDNIDKVALTFDDAYESVYFNAYPILKERGCGFTLFLVAGYIGDWNKWEVNIGGKRFRHMSWEQIASMENAEIGCHTLQHPSLAGLDTKTLKLELVKSKSIIEDKVQKRVKYLSLPFGRYDKKVIEIARESGYEAVCSMNPYEDSANGYIVGRYGVYLFDGSTALKHKLEKGFLNQLEKIKLKWINRLSGGTVIVKKWRRDSLSEGST